MGDKQTETPSEEDVNDKECFVKEEENTKKFEPVVKLEEVEVNSGEDDEEVLYEVRAKLFIFGETLLDVGTGKKTWRERGIGETRILRHKEHERIRILMRQEKTMKVIVNHAIDPRIQLQSNAGSDRSGFGVHLIIVTENFWRLCLLSDLLILKLRINLKKSLLKVKKRCHLS